MKKVTSITQILILLIGIIAFGYFVGGEVKVVSADDEDCESYKKEGECESAGCTWARMKCRENTFDPSGLVGAVAPAIVTNAVSGAEKVTKNADTAKKVAENGNAAEGGGLLSNLMEPFTIGSGNFLDIMGASLSWGVTLYFVSQFAMDMFGFSEGTTEAVSWALGGGAFAGIATYGWAAKSEFLKNSYLMKSDGLGLSAEAIGIGVGLIVAATIFVSLYTEEETEIVEFNCHVWEAPNGGNDCEKCNGNNVPCSEYQCKSLGQSCELLNPDDEMEARCEWVNRHDVDYPTISPWEDVLTEDHIYSPDSAISPPDSGVRIVSTETASGCIKAFTPIEFGIILDEPGQCKIDNIRRDSIEEMTYYFGGSSLYKYNHTQTISLPGTSALESANLTVQNDGEYSLYVRCKDANGNYNPANFVFKYCVDAGPDTTPPLIVTTNILNGQPVSFNESAVDIEVYVNEPANCKWSRTDQRYSDMETQMTCTTNLMEMNAQMLYKCSTTLDSIKNMENNTYYFRCEDQPNLPENDRNVNQESYEFVLQGSRPLVIDSVEPTETIKDSTDPVKVTLEVETSAGFNDGVSRCYYSPTEEEKDYIEFYNSNSYEHSQDLYLSEGDYEYFIKCVDLGGNADYNSTQFTVDIDREAPLVVRVYREESYLKLITDEEDSECVYDTSGCNFNFDEGISFIDSNDGLDHSAEWSTEHKFYIKCKDSYGNEPNPNECSLIVRPSEL